MIGKDPASGIEENAGRAFFQPLPSPRPGVAAYCFDQGLEHAARIARGMSAGHNAALVLARLMQEPLGDLRGSRGGRNSRYRFHSSPGLKARDRVRLSRFRCIAGA